MSEQSSLVLIPNKEDGTVLLGIATPLGVAPIMSFLNLRDLRKFGMGIIGYCEHFDPEIPEVFLKAFDESGGDDGKN